MTAALPDAAAVADTLGAIHASPEFARAPVMRHLLGYLVAETLAGRGDRLKAYSVAVDALGRSADFDAQTDSYPRVQVGRLRRMLDVYYGTGGAAGLRLSIPLGAYRVHFGNPADGAGDAAAAVGARRFGPWARRLAAALGIVLLIAAALAAVPWLATRNRDAAPAAVAVIPPPSIAIEAGDAGPSPLGRARLAEIARMVGTAFSRSAVATVSTGGAAVDARYALLLDMGSDERKLSMRLIDRSTGRLLWGDTIRLPDDPAATDETLRPTISALVRSSGIVAAHQRTEHHGDFAAGYPCLLQYDSYFRDRAAALRAPVDRCIARTIALDPTNAEALAAASYLQFDPSLTEQTAQSRERAGALARRATAADPYSAVAVVAEARAAVIAGNCVRGSGLAERAVALDSHDPETLGLMGMLLVRCDRPRGGDLLRAALRLDPEPTTFYVIALILIDIEQGRNAEAAAIAQAMRPPGAGMRAQYLLAQTLGSIAQGDSATAQARWKQLVAITPPPRDSVDAVLAHYYFAPDFRQMIARRLMGAGIGGQAPGRAADTLQRS